MRSAKTFDGQISEQAARLVKKFARSRIALHTAASRFDSLRDYYVAHASYCAELRDLLDYIGTLEAILSACLLAPDGRRCMYLPTNSQDRAESDEREAGR